MWHLIRLSLRRWRSQQQCPVKRVPHSNEPASLLFSFVLTSNCTSLNLFMAWEIFHISQSDIFRGVLIFSNANRASSASFFKTAICWSDARWSCAAGVTCSRSEYKFSAAPSYNKKRCEYHHSLFQRGHLLAKNEQRQKFDKDSGGYGNY